jgi:hypothetical protein
MSQLKNCKCKVVWVMGSFNVSFPIICSWKKSLHAMFRSIWLILNELNGYGYVKKTYQHLNKESGGYVMWWQVMKSWFYHKQIGRKQWNAAWVASRDPSPIIVRRNRYSPRTLICIFFKWTGPFLIHPVKRGQTIDDWYYINNCLQPVVDEIKIMGQHIFMKRYLIILNRKV